MIKIVKKSSAVNKSGKNKGKLKKGYRFAKGGRVVKVKKSSSTKKRKSSYMKTRNPKQTGKTNIAKDRKLKAKKVGWRISKSGKRYYEARANRSDKNKKKRL